MLFLCLLVLLVLLYLLRGTIALVAWLLRPYWPEAVALLAIVAAMWWFAR